jgi:hypothetical protein
MTWKSHPYRNTTATKKARYLKNGASCRRSLVPPIVTAARCEPMVFMGNILP